jgi:glycosyltransferase
MLPSISVITAVLNRAATIGQALASLQRQTWPRVEHIAIDGASTDGTVELLAAQRDRLAVLVSERDGGLYEALNRGLSRASGDVIGVLHSDDLYADDRVLERVAQAFDDPAVDGVYGDLDYVTSHDPSRVIRHWRAGVYSQERLAWGWMPPHPTLHLRRSVIETWGGFDASLTIAADYDAMLRYLKRGQIRLKYIPDVLVRMRVGGESNRSLSRLLRKTREDYVALRRHETGGVGTLILKNLRKLPQFVVR